MQRAGWRLAVQRHRDQEGWWAAIETLRGVSLVHGARTPIEAVDQAIEGVMSVTERGRC